METNSKLPSSKYLFAIVIIIAVSFGVYANTLFNGFVFDDNDQVLKNIWIKDIRYLPDILFSSVWSFSIEDSSDTKFNYYRPMMYLIYMIEYSIFGLKPWGWHLINIIFHSVNSIMVFLIAFRLFNKQVMLNQSQIPNPTSQIFSPALLAAIFFAVHPVNTEVVAWVAGVPELTFTLFYLLSFYLYIKYSVGSKNYIVAVILFFLATLSKETALTLPILLSIYDYAFRRDSIKTFSDYIKRYLPFAIVVAVYILLRIYALGGLAPQKPKHDYLTSFQYVINVFPLIVQYFGKLLLPVYLNVLHVFHPVYSIVEPRFIVSLLLTSSFFIFVILIRKINNLVFFALAWIFIPLLPVLYIPGVGEYTFAERYLYNPCVGFSILLTLGLKNIFRARSINAFSNIIVYISAVLVLSIITSYTVMTVNRNYDWKNDLSLWSDSAHKSPDSIFASYNLGRAYQEYGLFDNAIYEYKDILRHNPSFIKVRNNLGVALGQKGLYAEAIAEFKEVLLTAPEDRDARYNMGLAYLKMGDCDTARNILKLEKNILIRQLLDKCSK